MDPVWYSSWGFSSHYQNMAATVTKDDFILIRPIAIEGKAPNIMKTPYGIGKDAPLFHLRSSRLRDFQYAVVLRVLCTGTSGTIGKERRTWGYRTRNSPSLIWLSWNLQVPPQLVTAPLLTRHLTTLCPSASRWEGIPCYKSITSRG
jgi:hypothetical protein